MTEQTTRPRYLVWVAGARATIGTDIVDAYRNGEMLGLAEELTFIEDENEPSCFNIKVESPEEGIDLIKRIANCIGIGLIELEDDGEYHEWYDAEGNSSTDIADREVD